MGRAVHPSTGIKLRDQLQPRAPQGTALRQSMQRLPRDMVSPFVQSGKIVPHGVVTGRLVARRRWGCSRQGVFKAAQTEIVGRIGDEPPRLALPFLALLVALQGLQKGVYRHIGLQKGLKGIFFPHFSGISLPKERERLPLRLLFFLLGSGSCLGFYLGLILCFRSCCGLCVCVLLSFSSSSLLFISSS